MIRFLFALGLLLGLLLPAGVGANAPALQVSPLLYEDTLTDKPKKGSIDVSNPTDAPIVVDVMVRGFKQQGSRGDLQFEDNPDLAAAIQTDLKQFELGPREAIRVLFTIEPSKLPAGGVFAAIFFATRPSENVSGSSYVSQSAKVGTLIVLRNGGDAKPQGGLTELKLPLWQFGSGIGGRVTVENGGAVKGGVAYRPELSSQVLFGQPVKIGSGLVLPGTKRYFDIARPGAFIGIFPVTVRDAATDSTISGWVVACTGWYQWLVLVLGVGLVVLVMLRITRQFRRRRSGKIHEMPDDPVADEAVPTVTETGPEEEPDAVTEESEIDVEAPTPEIDFEAEPEPVPEAEPDSDPESEPEPPKPDQKAKRHMDLQAPKPQEPSKPKSKRKPHQLG